MKKQEFKALVEEIGFYPAINEIKKEDTMWIEKLAEASEKPYMEVYSWYAVIHDGFALQRLADYHRSKGDLKISEHILQGLAKNPHAAYYRYEADKPMDDVIAINEKTYIDDLLED